MRVPAIACCLLFRFALPALVLGQTLSADAIRQINTASKARVNLVERGRGTVYNPTADSSSVAFARSEFMNNGGVYENLASPFEVTHVTEIQVARGTHAGKGAAIGGGIGAVIGLLTVAVASGESLGSPTTGETVGAIALCTGVGAGVGALLGLTSTRWKTVYAGEGGRP
jgi:hypothetical protein